MAIFSLFLSIGETFGKITGQLIFEKTKRGAFTVNRRRVWSDQSFEPPPSKHWPQTDQDNIKTGCIIDDYGFIDNIDRFL